MSSNLRILAIDPGASGGLVEIIPGQLIDAVAYAMPDDHDLVAFLRNSKEASEMEGHRLVAYIEQVGGFIAGNPAPGSAMFNFGRGYGFILGILAALQVETHLVRPQAWQAGISGLKGQEKALRKRALKEHAARLFPKLTVTLKTADALCIADYARRAEGAKGAVAA